MQYPLFLLAAVTDPPPSENDVKAGWGALALMLLLIAAVVFLLWSFTRQIRKVRAAQEAGVFDDADDKS
jgi:predicted permease